MANCALCSSEHTTFMNASVCKSNDGGSVCRTCFIKITKLKPSINIKKYSLEDINNILLGKEIEKPNAEQENEPKMDSKLIFGSIKFIIGLILLYLGIKYLIFK
jgi:Ca2+/Na+ antiporter